MALNEMLGRFRRDQAASPDRARPPTSPAAIIRADELAATGRYADAIELLSDARREHTDGELEIRLVDLRHEAAEAKPRGEGRLPWPPACPDPFPEVSGRLVEINRDNLDGAVLGGAVAHHGALLVRGLFDPDQVARGIEMIDRAGAARESADHHVDLETRSWYRPLESARSMDRSLRAMVGAHGGTWLGDSPRALAEILRELTEVGAIAAITEHFGERPVISLQKSTLRRSAPVHALAGWHQDGSFLGADTRAMNVWVALTPCGGDRPTPGLEVVPARMPNLLDTDGGTGSASINGFTVLYAAAAGSTPMIHPEFEAGDALLFDERFVHRTHLTENMTQYRYAIECWFFAPSHPSETYVTLLV